MLGNERGFTPGVEDARILHEHLNPLALPETTIDRVPSLSGTTAAEHHPFSFLSLRRRR
jgi:hypothetical protein